MAGVEEVPEDPGLIAGTVKREAPAWDPNIIRVSGNIEVTDAEVSFKIAGRVDSRLVDEGELVQKGATVALLDRSDLLSELAMREAELRGAQAALNERAESAATAFRAMVGRSTPPSSGSGDNAGGSGSRGILQRRGRCDGKPIPSSADRRASPKSSGRAGSLPDR